MTTGDVALTFDTIIFFNFLLPAGFGLRTPAPGRRSRWSTTQLQHLQPNVPASGPPNRMRR
jgi:hypothetical protein